MAKKQKLELTWIGKDQQPNLEPRILVEDPDRSYGDPNAENMLVHGDNLLALRALEQGYAGKVKCIYIDPPFNTGQAFQQYEDGVEHSIWLTLMRDRLSILRRLLAPDGSIWVHCDDCEQAYLKVVMDEVFGRGNFITAFVWQKVDSPNDNKVPITPDHEYILCYSRNPGGTQFRQKPDPSLLESYRGPDESGRYYRDCLLKKNGKNSLRSDRPSMFFAIPGPDGKDVFPIHDDGREARWAMGKDTVTRLIKNDEIVWKERDRAGGRVWVPYTREYAPESPSRPYPSIWTDVMTTRQAKAHLRKLFPGEDLFETPKPEQLLSRILDVATLEGDCVLDSFLGSGTTSAAAHKKARRWIGIELGEHCDTHCVPRLKQVCDGTDQGGISEAIEWKGGGGFKYYELAPSLLKQDHHGNWVISQEYNADMLAAAMAKHEGFRYSPDPEVYWKHGQSSEKDFIFTTTSFIRVDFLDRLHEEMREDEHLLICCKKFSAACVNRFTNIEVKKIPHMLLGRCEFGRDDYSLNIVNMPRDPNAPDFVPAGPPPTPAKPKRKGPMASDRQGELF